MSCTAWQWSYFQPCCQEEEKGVLSTYQQRHKEYPPRSESASFLALACCRLTFINKSRLKKSSCDQKHVWSYNGESATRTSPRSTCSFFRLRSSVYLFVCLSLCCFRWAIGRAVRCASSCPFYARFWGRVFQCTTREVDRRFGFPKSALWTQEWGEKTFPQNFIRCPDLCNEIQAMKWYISGLFR